MDDEDPEELDNDDNGWKIIHTDVFRFPPYKNLFCAVLGMLIVQYWPDKGASCLTLEALSFPAVVGSIFKLKPPLKSYAETLSLAT